MKKKETKPDSTAATEGEDEDWKFHRAMAEVPESRAKELRGANIMWSCLLFVVLAAIAFVLRWHELIPSISPYVPDVLPYIADYGFYLVIVFHIMVTLIAFKEDVFQGILCLLVPFYWLYYLFLVIDSFYVRAVVAGCLIAVAYDSFFSFRDIWGVVFEHVNEFLKSGGGDIRRKEG